MEIYSCQSSQWKCMGHYRQIFHPSHPWAPSFPPPSDQTPRKNPPPHGGTCPVPQPPICSIKQLLHQPQQSQSLNSATRLFSPVSSYIIHVHVVLEQEPGRHSHPLRRQLCFLKQSLSSCLLYTLTFTQIGGDFCSSPGVFPRTSASVYSAFK